jgi:hypothetical protein
MAKFVKIGIGEVYEKKKTGTKSIKLTLDPAAQKQLLNHDWERGIYIFKDRFVKTKYVVMVPMPDDYSPPSA